MLDKYSLARSPYISLEVLEELSTDNDSNVRYYVARNENSSSSILELLSKDSISFVRRAVAFNTNCPDYILESLSDDSDWNVKYYVIYNSNCSIKAIRKLLLSKDKLFPINKYIIDSVMIDNKSKEVQKFLKKYKMLL